MIELVMGPTSEQIAVHTPFVMEAGGELNLFYSRADYPPGEEGEPCRKKYNIFRARSSDGGGTWRADAEPIIELEDTVCRPWVVEEGGGYRMFFVERLHPMLGQFRVFAATSPDLESWQVESQATIPDCGDCEHIATPCVVRVNGKLRMYFTGARFHKDGDSLYVAESGDGKKFKVDKKPKFKPEKGAGYGKSCYAPFVYEDGGKWKMLFSGLGKQHKGWRTYLSESSDGLKFKKGKLVIDLSDDGRFENGAYKAVLFGDQVYFVGVGGDQRASIYRAPRAEFGL
jgi:predicted GH43/DUF377 family glycosyl hydrolase